MCSLIFFQYKKNIDNYLKKEGNIGVYIIQHKLYPEWIKIGHHKITTRRPNVYFRFVRRGFHSCVCPPLLRHYLDFKHVELLAFYPNLTTKEEKQIHRYLEHEQSKTRYGEWFKDCELMLLYQYIEVTSIQGIMKMPTIEDLEYAKQQLKVVDEEKEPSDINKMVVRKNNIKKQINKKKRK